MRQLRRLVLCIETCVLFTSLMAVAQQAATTSVPNLIRYSGTLRDAQGAALPSSTVGVTFAMYRQQEGGAPVWLETQSVTTDAVGNFNVLLGVSAAAGLPADLFVGNEERWLGMQAEGGAEQARVLLVSVPYALKAHDAETLGGLPASAFMPAGSSAAGESVRTAQKIPPGPPPPGAVIGGDGLPNYIPIWRTPIYLQSSAIYQNPTTNNIGIGTTSPATTLDVNGGVNSASSYFIGGSKVVSVGNANDFNLFLGALAGFSNLSGQGRFNTFTGYQSGGANTTGNSNTFLGYAAGNTNTTGSGNLFSGSGAGASNVSGSYNVFSGYLAGLHNASGSNNIYISNQGPASGTESNTIRIGTQGTGQGQQSSVYIAGITNNTIGSGNPVYVDANGMLGVGSGGGGGGVTSWDGRSGAVVPQSGDYSFSLLSGTLADGQLSGAYSSPLTLSNASNLMDGTFNGSFTGNGAGLTGVPVSSGSPNYIQNGTAQQSSASFNIDGNGTVGGTLTGATGINTGGTYQFNGNDVVAISTTNQNTLLGNTGRDIGSAGTYSTFVGDGAGFSNTTGLENTFVGTESGVSNVDASYNTFLGAYAGHSNTSGTDNTLVGDGAGTNSSGSSNTFLGSAAGANLASGDYNIFVGGRAGQNAATADSDIYIANDGVDGETHTVRIGTQGSGGGQQKTTYIAGITSTIISSGNPVYVDSNGKLGIGSGGSGGVTSWNGRTGAVVPQSGDYSFSLLSGTLADGQLTGSYSNQLSLTSTGNLIAGIFTGDGSGLTGVPVSSGSPNYIQNGTTQQASANFNISGNGTAGGTLTSATAVNTNGTYQIAGQTVINVPNDGTMNMFLGNAAGAASTPSSARDVFLGFNAGIVNTIGTDNTFVGTYAGGANTTGINNMFVGSFAGASVSSGNENVAVGTFAGDSITTGNMNTLLGNTTGYSLTTGSSNIIIGWEAGNNVSTGSNEILIGNSTEGPAESNTIRIGTNGQHVAAYVAGINGQIIASGSPVYVDANGMLGIGSGGGGGVTSWNGRSGAVVPATGDYSFSQISGTASVFQIPSLAGLYIQNGSAQQAGGNFNIDGNGTVGGTLSGGNVSTAGTYQINGTTAFNATIDSVMVGFDTGSQNTGFNTFVGASAGSSNTTGSGNTFLGFHAGLNNATSGGSTYVGSAAGYVAHGGGNTVLGANSAGNLSDGSFNLMLGNGTGGNVASGSHNIYVAGSGAADESNTIRIGNSTQTATYIGGINGATVSSGAPVYVDSTGKLGTLGGSGGGGGVTSWNSRTGVVLPATGDYNFTQISGTASVTQIPSLASLYIQNGTSQQTSANFNISGNGTVAGTVTASLFDTPTDSGKYRLDGVPVLATLGDNVGVGQYAASGITTGGSNAGLGQWALVGLTSGQNNTALGVYAGQNLVAGSDNTFVGEGSGYSTTGNNNTFVGSNSGSNITSGASNTFIGMNAGHNITTGSSNIYLMNAGSGTDSNTIRIGTAGTGTGQQNTTYIAGITGNLISGGSPVYIDSTGKLGVGSTGGSGVTSFNGRTGVVVSTTGDYNFSQLSGMVGNSQLSGNYTNAAANPLAGSPNYIQNGTSQQTGANLNIDGNGTLGGTLTATAGVNTNGSYSIHNGVVINIPAGGNTNTFVGYQTGTAGSNNTYIGRNAGQADTGSTDSTIIGYNAGPFLSAAALNTFVGVNAGFNDTTGNHNTLLGAAAGRILTTGSNDIEIGHVGGSATESNTIRIGTQGTGAGQQNATYIAGINGATVSSGSAVYVDSTGKLGTLGGSGGGGVTSWNGRTGAVVPANGDYSFSLLSGSLASSQLSGAYSNAVTFSNSGNSFTGDGAGLTNVPDTGGSGFYIQNSTSRQTSANFNISGSGTAGGNLTAGGTVSGVEVNSNGIYRIADSAFLQGDGDSVYVGTGVSTSGFRNTVVGSLAGHAVSGAQNVFIGFEAFSGATTGSNNTVIGAATGVAVLAGSNNVVIGYGAGSQLDTSSEILIANSGLEGESHAIRLGTDGNGAGEQDKTYIAGIRGATASGGINVLVSSDGKLGTTTSSRRFKDNITDMGAASSKLFDLRPVTFFYKPQYDDGSHILQYGLIAEEVAKIYPDLVVYDENGQPQTIRYHLLTPMLLNELQKQHAVVAAQQEMIKTQQQQIDDLQQRLSRLETMVGRMADANIQK